MLAYTVKRGEPYLINPCAFQKPKLFSSDVGTGSREENTLIQSELQSSDIFRSGADSTVQRWGDETMRLSSLFS
jgi:hypothetical protein